MPQGANILRAIANNDIHSAYKCACLGATESDWRMLGMKALQQNNIHIAKNAFARLKDIKYLSLLETMKGSSAKLLNTAAISAPGVEERSKRRGKENSAIPESRNASSAQTQVQVLDTSIQAEVLAYEGHILDAAKLYARNGKSDEALRVMLDMRRFDDAKLFTSGEGFCAYITHL